MLFHSETFLFWFLPVVLGLYYLLPAARRVYLLTISSYVFYAGWNPLFCPLMLLSTSIDYVAGGRIAASTSARERKIALILALSANLLLLGFFKYYGLFSSTLADVAGNPLLPVLQIVLPVGISFYTFQSMSYTIDLYRGRAKPAKDFWHFACYVSLFPQLVAGPIVRYHELAEQLDTREHTWSKAAEGAYRFVLGLGKKVLIADTFARLADTAFADPGSLGMVSAWAGLIAYALQLYYDFSGYSDMAIGLGLLFGFRFPENFNLPYHARSIGEFWRRWHMTMSNWFRDYVYIPLGGNRSSRARTMGNLLLTMGLAGLWHGAAWTFLAWGLYHGALLACERIAGSRLERIPSVVRHAMTVLLVLLGWVPFRSASFADAGTYLRALAVPASSSVSAWWLAAIAAGIAVVILEPRIPLVPARFSRRHAVFHGAILVACIAMLFGGESSPFLYFQF